MNTTLTLIRRELLEHRAVFFAPATLTVIFLLATLYGVFKAIGADDQMDGVFAQLRGLEPGEAGVRLRALLSAALISLAVPFNLVMSVVSAFYLLDCLHSERKDRSVLFWRSLPVSDTQTVLSKLLTGLVAIAAVELIAVLIAYVLTGVVLSVALVAVGENPFALLWLPAPWVSGPLFLIYTLLAQLLWFAPFAGWLLLVSAAARQAPLLWAVGVPAALSYVEYLLLQQHRIFDAIVGHLRDFPVAAMSDRDFRFDSDEFGGPWDGLEGADGPTTLLSLPDPAGFVSSPSLWIGLALTAVFVGGAIRMRRYHDV